MKVINSVYYILRINFFEYVLIDDYLTLMISADRALDSVKELK